MDDEGTCVHVADRVDETHHAACAAHVEAGQGLFAKGVQVEERIAGEYVSAVEDEPVVDLSLLCLCRMQVMPAVCTAA